MCTCSPKLILKTGTGIRFLLKENPPIYHAPPLTGYWNPAHVWICAEGCSMFATCVCECVTGRGGARVKVLVVTFKRCLVLQMKGILSEVHLMSWLDVCSDQVNMEATRFERCVSEGHPTDRKSPSPGKRHAVKRHHHKHNLKHRYDFLETLGKGTYGKVKKAVDRTGNMVRLHTL